MTNNNVNLISIVPICSYFKADTQKEQIIKDNLKKAGIYRWTNLVSGKCYVGSSTNLSIRFKNYFNVNYLEREVRKNNSRIYRALLKYGYSKFKLDIIEYCDPAIIIKREQYYLNNLNIEYNILKVARSLKGFKHNITTIERMRMAKLGYGRDEATKLKIAANSHSYPVIIRNNITGEIKLFISIRRAAKFIGIHHSYLAKCLKVNEFYKGKGYFITKYII